MESKKQSLLIQSTSQDISTDKVCDWLKFLSQDPIKRINDVNQIKYLTCKIGKDNITKMELEGDEIFRSDKIKSYWYRRGMLSYNPTWYLDATAPFDTNIGILNQKQLDLILQHSYDRLSANGLGNFSDNFINKLSVLSKANDLGLEIPQTLVTNNPDELEDFFNVYADIIIKPISSSRQFIRYSNDEYELNYSSQRIRLNDYKKKDKIGFTFAQQYIIKKYEIRTFLINNKIYSMCIFSQQDKLTEIDYRNYNVNNPNRCVPYNLPDYIEEKLRSLMTQLKLNTGSFDIILDTKGRYVFLEVNPIGQYDWLTQNCNYYIDKLIAQVLLKDRHDNF